MFDPVSCTFLFEAMIFPDRHHVARRSRAIPVTLVDVSRSMFLCVVGGIKNDNSSLFRKAFQ